MSTPATYLNNPAFLDTVSNRLAGITRRPATVRRSSSSQADGTNRQPSNQADGISNPVNGVNKAVREANTRPGLVTINDLIIVLKTSVEAARLMSLRRGFVYT
jgi:hypothetical protein